MPAALVEECKRAWARVAKPWRRESSLSCDQVSTALPAILDRGEEASVALVSHVEYCLACQAELARYRKLIRLLHQLRTNEVALPPGVVADVLSTLEGAAQRRAVRSVLTGRSVAYASAVLAAAGATAALVMLARARRGATGLEPARARELSS